MKRFLVFMLVVMLMALPLVASAEEAEPVTTETTSEQAEESMTDIVVEYVKDHIEEILVVIFMAVGSLYEARLRGKLNGSVGTLNNNAISIAQNSAATIKEALAGVEAIAGVVNKYKDDLEGLLGEIRKSAEEKKALEDTLTHVEGFLKTSKLATIELANEVADLLVLSNIPVSKKEELYSRHRAAVDAIAVAEGEVTAHDGEKA
jgi:hypothetical protein